MRIIISVLLIMLLISCGSKKSYTKKVINGVEVISNKSPVNKDSKIKLKNKISLDFNGKLDYIEGIKADSKGNFFISDGENAKIYKFDSKGQYEKSFCKKGNGPGEVPYLYTFSIVNDTIYIPEYRSRKLLMYSNEGEFVRELTYDNQKNMPNMISSLEDGYLVLFNESDWNKETRIWTKVDVLYKTDYSFKRVSEPIDKLTQIYDYKKGAVNSYFQKNLRFVTDKDRIYIGKPTEDNYRFDAYDTGLNKIYSAKKSYIKHPITDEVKTQIDEVNKQGRMNVKADFFLAYNNFSIDNQGRLWVDSAESNKDEKNIIYNVFEDGVLTHKVKLPIEEGKRKYFDSGKVYSIDTDTSVIDIFDVEVI